jgi:hypothetical protein
VAATQLMWRLRGVVPHAPWLVALVQHVEVTCTSADRKAVGRPCRHRGKRCCWVHVISSRVTSRHGVCLTAAQPIAEVWMELLQCHCHSCCTVVISWLMWVQWCKLHFVCDMVAIASS